MVDGYDADDVNRVFDRLEEATGLSLVCVWEYFDSFGVGGNSQFFVALEDDRFHEVAGDLWQWLNGDPHSFHPGRTGIPWHLGRSAGRHRGRL